ncbi:unnamed protein product, partial [Musa acuminata subsp. burmannicoides]
WRRRRHLPTSSPDPRRSPVPHATVSRPGPGPGPGPVPSPAPLPPCPPLPPPPPPPHPPPPAPPPSHSPGSSARASPKRPTPRRRRHRRPPSPPLLPGPVPVRPLPPAQEAPLAAGPRLPRPVRGRPRPVRQGPSRRRRRDGGALGSHRRPAEGGVHDRSLPALRLVRLLQGHVLRRGGDGASPPGSLLRFARPPARFNHHRRFEIGIQTRPKLDAE